MGLVPTTEQIEEEANSFENLGFFKKSKNVLVIFILVTTGISLFLIGTIEDAFGSGAAYELALSAILAIFIYFNHRWAMALFCIIYLANKIIFLLSGFGSPFSQIIFAAIVVVLTYSSFRVATELKRNKAQA